MTPWSLLTLCLSAPSGFPEKDFGRFLVILVGLLVGAVALFSMGLMFLCKR